MLLEVAVVSALAISVYNFVVNKTFRTKVETDVKELADKVEAVAPKVVSEAKTLYNDVAKKL